MTDSRPELLGDVIQDCGFHLSSPIPGRLLPAALLRRIVSVGETRFERISNHFGPIEARTSGVGLGNDSTRQGIAKAAEKASVTHRVVARIFVRDRGHNGFREKGSGDAIREGAPVIPRIALDSGTQLRN